MASRGSSWHRPQTRRVVRSSPLPLRPRSRASSAASDATPCEPPAAVRPLRRPPLPPPRRRSKAKEAEASAAAAPDDISTSATKASAVRRPLPSPPKAAAAAPPGRAGHRRRLQVASRCEGKVTAAAPPALTSRRSKRRIRRTQATARPGRRGGGCSSRADPGRLLAHPRPRRRRGALLEDGELLANDIVITDTGNDRGNGANMNEGQRLGDRHHGERLKACRPRKKAGHRCCVCGERFPTSQLAVVGADDADFDWLGSLTFRCVNCKMPAGLKEKEQAEFRELHDTLVREQQRRRAWAVVAHARQRQGNGSRRQVAVEAARMHASTASAEAVTTTAASENNVVVVRRADMPGASSDIATKKNRTGKRQIGVAAPNKPSAPVEESQTAVLEMSVRRENVVPEEGSYSYYSYESDRGEEPACAAEAAPRFSGDAASVENNAERHEREARLAEKLQAACPETGGLKRKTKRGAAAAVQDTPRPKSGTEPPQPLEGCAEAGDNVDDNVQQRKKRGKRSGRIAQQKVEKLSTSIAEPLPSGEGDGQLDLPMEACPEAIADNACDSFKLKGQKKRKHLDQAVGEQQTDSESSGQTTPTKEKRARVSVQAAQAAQAAMMAAYANQVYPAGYGCASFDYQTLGWPQTMWPGANTQQRPPPPPPPPPPAAVSQHPFLGGQVDFEDI